MKIQLSQREVSQLIANYLYKQKLVKSEFVSIEYEMNTGITGNELTVSVTERL